MPKGFLRGFGELLRGDAYGPVRSLALVAGIAAASLGYVRAGLRERVARREPSSDRA